MKSLYIITLALACQLAWAEPTVQVVLSVPLETNLTVPNALDCQTTWLEMINGAKNTLDIEQFYVSDQAGQPLEAVLQAIQEAGKRGVRVRLLTDSKFFKTYPESVTNLGKVANSEARIIDYGKYGGVQHAKFFIVDGNDSFSGSQNFDWRALNHIHEVGLRVIDTGIAGDMLKIFEKDWAEGTLVSKGTPSRDNVEYPKPADVNSDLFVVAAPAVANPKGILYSGDQIIKLMNAATKTLRIQVMEYSLKPANGGGKWNFLNDGILATAKRGVKVQLMVDFSDVKKAKADLIALSKVKNVEVRVTTIPQFSGGAIEFARLIHSKYLISDDADSWVGSENWSQGYFTQTRDVGFVIHSLETTETLTQIFDKLWNSSYSVKFTGAN